MAKLNSEEIAAMSIKRANFSNNMWQIVVMTPDNKIYMVRFNGAEGDSNEVLLAKTHEMLLEVEKQEEVVLPTNIVRNDIVGLNPNNNA